jgi:glutathione S-transferase
MANSRSMRVVWVLEEIGVEYDYVKVDLLKGEGRSPGYLAINPAGKVPVLVDGDFTLTESVAILNYLSEKFPASGLAPAFDQLQARGEYHRWCSFVLSELEQPLWNIAKHRFALPRYKRGRPCWPRRSGNSAWRRGCWQGICRAANTRQAGTSAPLTF